MKKGLILTLLTVVLTSLLCIGLYRMDNKYTHQSPQPINGILFSEESLTYLTRQWMVYPDVLLTPEEVSEYQGYRYYKNIGENGKNKSGSMTYRLTLLLPEEIHEYALELPEVFSACRLYVNDRLLLQLGEPSPEMRKVYSTVLRAQTIETAGLGSSIAGFVGMGVFKSFEEAMDSMVHHERVFNPDPRSMEIYERLYKDVYLPLYPKMRPLYQRIREIYAGH